MTIPFVKKAISVHGKKYDYSLVSYKNSKSHVDIICPFHGSFSQTPSNHLRHGCSECGKESSWDNQHRRSTKEFIKKAKKVHGKTYDYSQCEYKSAHEKVNIICKKHGLFAQSANSHLRGRGCAECKQGEGHPRFGQPPPSACYYGKWKNWVFRSLPELYCMYDFADNGIDFIGIDQKPYREKWQVKITREDGSPATYCADFYIPKDNLVIDIKPKWRAKEQERKLSLANPIYESRGYEFKVVDCDSIRRKLSRFRKDFNSGEVWLSEASVKRFRKRFDK